MKRLSVFVFVLLAAIMLSSCKIIFPREDTLAGQIRSNLWQTEYPEWAATYTATHTATHTATVTPTDTATVPGVNHLGTEKVVLADYMMWDVPSAGAYNSDDPATIQRHVQLA